MKMDNIQKIPGTDRFGFTKFTLYVDGKPVSKLQVKEKPYTDVPGQGFVHMTVDEAWDLINELTAWVDSESVTGWPYGGPIEEI